MPPFQRRGQPFIAWSLLAFTAFAGGTAYANDADDDGVMDVDDGCPSIWDPLQEDTSPLGPDGAGDACAHPLAVVALTATNGGMYMAARSALGERSTTGPLTVIARRAQVGDDVTVGSDVMIGRASAVGSDVTIGTGSDLGYAAVVGAGAQLGARTVVGSLAMVGPDVVLNTDVIIARSASVLAQSVGANSIVGPGTTVATGATVGSGVRIRKYASIAANVTIGNGTRIGRNAVVGEGAEIGSSSIIGPGAIIEPGATVPDEARVGRNEVVEGPGVPQGFGLFAGWQYSCAINADESVQCWGDGWGGGNLGHGLDSSSNTGVSVLGIGDTLAGAQSIAGDMDGACALLTDGSVYCWGSKFGTNAPTVPISGLTDPVELFGGGSGHTFFCVRNGGGTVQCWGNNRFGQLGNGIATLASDFTTTPVAAIGLTDVTGVARGVGSAGACVIHATGELSCWGQGEYGELGFAASQTCHSTPCEPTPTKVPGVANVAKAAVGHRNTCALFDNGSVDCWGNNTAGQLGQTGGGNGPGDLVEGLPGPATEIGAGTYHVCALVSGTEYCWGGSNQTTIVPGPSPYAIAAGGTVVDISPGDNHSCLRLDDGTVKCWGYNDGGSLGNGTDYTDENVPAVVQGIP